VSDIRWGILATGNIAHSFAGDLRLVPGARLSAVGSRSLGAAQDFAAAHGAVRAHGSYEELASDPDVDVVYVATPHSLHRANVELCLAAGKAVLCEKALALNADDAAAMVATSRASGLFLMEAMWMRCNPTILAIQDAVAAGAIGAVTAAAADFGFVPNLPSTDRVFDPALGASALLDIGIYPLTFASLFLGEPERIVSTGTLSERGIDLACSSALGYADGAVASVSCTMTAVTPCHAFVAGRRGRIELEPRFSESRGFTLTNETGQTTYKFDVRGKGYVHEIEEVHRCLQEGHTESRLVPLDDSLALMRQMDLIRRQIGSTLPGDPAR
jgi:predicted dehydrogenase